MMDIKTVLDELIETLEELNNEEKYLYKIWMEYHKKQLENSKLDDNCKVFWKDSLEILMCD